MTTAQMWWAADSYWQDGTTGVTASFPYTGFLLNGKVENRGSTPIVLTANTTYVHLRRHFFLDRGRMPAPIYYESIPEAILTGAIKAQVTSGSTPGWPINPAPQSSLAECRLELRQTVAPRTPQAVSSLMGRTLVSASPNSSAQAGLPITLAFTPVSVALDRAVDLYIELDIILWFRFIGDSSLEFTAFNIAAPQWSIIAVPG